MERPVNLPNFPVKVDVVLDAIKRAERKQRAFGFFAIGNQDEKKYFEEIAHYSSKIFVYLLKLALCHYYN